MNIFKSYYRAALLYVVAVLLPVPCSGAMPPSRQPNVILIMADDLGYHDLGCYGHPQIKTPVLDKLAADGIRLTSFYSGATVCTPSRMALLTGAYPSRLGWTKGVIGHLISTKQGLSPDALTIAEIYKDQGYATGLVGKWHIGNLPQLLPQQRGFDYTYYIKQSNNQSDTILRGDEVVEKPFANRLLSEKFTAEAVRFINDNKERPFFLYLPYTAPHFPVEPHPDWKGKSAFGAGAEPNKAKQDYGDVVEELDARIGQVLDGLKRADIDKNTIVIFLSDNGPQNDQQAQADPYRGKKWGSLEGGTRVPCIIRWPAKIPAGRESSALIAAIDLLPTLCAASGFELKNITKGSPVIDGVDVLPTLFGNTDSPHPRNDLLYWHGKDGFHAIRAGNWKLFLKREGAELGAAGSGPALFNLEEDAEELTDLSAKYPEKVRELEALAKKRLEEIRKAVIPLAGEAPQGR